MASSLPSLEGIAAGARFNLCAGLQAGNLGAAFIQALGVDSPDVAEAYPSLFEWACDIPPANAPAPPQPPFIGGQCPTQYTVDGVGPTSIGPGTMQWILSGPISGPRFVPTSAGNGRIEFLDGQGIWRQIDSGQASVEQSNYPAWSYTVTRNDGLPDDCGNPPFDPPLPTWPPNGAPVTGPITYNDENNTPVNITGEFVFQAPIVNINNQVEVNFAVEVTVDNRQYRGTINLSTGDVSVTPTFVGPGRPDITIDAPPAAPQPPSSDPDTPDDGSANLIVAMVVTMSIADNNQATERLYAGQPTTTVPRVGVARFACPLPGGGSAVWTADIPIKQTRQYIPCPSPYGAVAIAASPEPGSGNVVLSTVPVRGRPEASLS